jgi:hypothetical protein
MQSALFFFLVFNKFCMQLLIALKVLASDCPERVSSRVTG